MAVLKADLDVCQGYANCVFSAPDAFDVDDEEGKVILLKVEISDIERPRIEDAARSCPVSALRVED